MGLVLIVVVVGIAVVIVTVVAVVVVLAVLALPDNVITAVEAWNQNVPGSSLYGIDSSSGMRGIAWGHKPRRVLIKSQRLKSCVTTLSGNVRTV